MFSQVFVILSLRGGGGVDQDQVTTPPPQDETRLQHLPPRMRPGYNTSPLGWDQVTTPPHQDQTGLQHLPPQDETRSQHPPPPRMRPGYTPSPGTMHGQAVRILLECILVDSSLIQIILLINEPNTK